MTAVAGHDVIVIGAGPGGSSAAIRLAEGGLNVAIIERLPFPRPHVGICISDQTIALLDYLDIGESICDAGYWRRYLTAVHWGDPGFRLVPQTGYHVDRARLDQSLLNKARSAGVTVYQPASILEMQLLKRSERRITIETDGRRQMLHGRFTVDAAGRRPAIRGPRIRDSAPLVAAHAPWTLERQPEFDGLIESGENAWLWFAQTARDKAVVSIFCDPRRLKSAISGDLQDTYTYLLQQFQVLQPSAFGKQCSTLTLCDASSHHSEDPVADHHIRVGDACLCVDPLSSQGVHLALQSGIQAAAVVQTILRRTENAGLAKQFFRMRVSQRISRFTDRTKEEYARVAVGRSDPFWLERAGRVPVTNSNKISPTTEPPAKSPPKRVSVSADATFELTPVIEGSFVEERRALRHPNLEDAIAYVDGVDLIALLSVLPQEFYYSDIPTYWNSQIPMAKGSKIAMWLWNNRILVKAA